MYQSRRLSVNSEIMNDFISHIDINIIIRHIYKVTDVLGLIRDFFVHLAIFCNSAIQLQLIKKMTVL